MKGFYDKNKNTIWTVGGIAVGVLTLALILPKRDITGTAPVKDDRHTNPQGGNFDPFQVASQLFDVMSSWGKNSATVLEIMKNRVPASGFGALKTAFGTPKYNWVTGGQTLGSNRDLIYWIKNETTSDHYVTIKSMFPNQPWI